MIKICHIIFLSILAMVAQANTFFQKEVVNPLTGAKVKVQALGSTGSYVNQWPSRYDLIFAPDYYEQWVWFDPKSGYGSFHEDFEKLSEPEITRIRDWLKSNYDSKSAPQTHIERLIWLGKIYQLRDKDAEFWRWYNRLMVYIFRDSPEKMKPYMQKEIELMEKFLPEAKDLDVLEAIWILGEYNRRMGNFELAEKYFSRLHKEKYKNEDGTSGVGHPYFMGLLKRVEKLSDEKSTVHPALAEESKSN